MAIDPEYDGFIASAGEHLHQLFAEQRLFSVVPLPLAGRA